ncbi:MAG: cryptochrome/photolyase family protein [Candidatus Magasanikbacteria bacterium]
MNKNKNPQEVALVFPNQLFKNNSAIENSEKVFLIEDPLFFKQFSFHKKKLVLHRASMKWYEDQISKPTVYIDSNQIDSTQEISEFLPESIEKAHLLKPVDDWLRKGIEKAFEDREISIFWHGNPSFIFSLEKSKSFIDKDNFLLEKFYRKARKERNILIDSDGEPAGGKWNFDEENRKSFPKNKELPSLKDVGLEQNSYVEEAIKYVEDNFADNYGNIENFYFPINRKGSLKWFEDFLKERFSEFGSYQDAISSSNHTAFHSLISPMLNIGLITPEEVINRATDYLNKGVPINSVEGFIRQILGWREFMRLTYQLKGSDMRTSNLFSHEKDMPDSFWRAETGIEPVDETIDFIINHGFTHHIERLMILSNFMLLCEINPKDVYKWFMELFIDSYDWVMVPNVYEMGQFSSGGIFATKPYISSSNYILKMSDYNEGKWARIWDGLYWRFLNKNKEILKQNYRMSLVLHHLNKMNDKELEKHEKVAENYLTDLFS